jgi:hypothetical protein
MAIRHEANGAEIKAARYLTRVFAVVLGVAAAAWGASLLPLFRQQTGPNAVAQKLIQGDTFDLQSVVVAARQAEAASKFPDCNPTAARALVGLRLAVINASVSAKQAPPEGAYEALYDASRGALSCAPADAFVWLALFWLDAVKRGFNSQNEGYLRLSYRVGPNESWIALGRNRLAFALFDRLPKDLSDDAVEEFIGILDTGRLFWEAAAIFASLPAAAQNRILEQLKDAKPLSRRGLAEMLHKKGLEIAIPGMQPENPRPWR